MMNFEKYNTWIFDCDGVLLDSNPVKTDAFFEAALPYGRRYAEALVEYHREFGGVSRFLKFRHFFERILQAKDYEKELDEILRRYGTIVRERLLACPEAPGMRKFLGKIPGRARKIVVSGGMETELREIFLKRGLHTFFDAIFGSPESKEAILQREKGRGLLDSPSVYFGDARYDFDCARLVQADFVFMHKLTEFEGWKDYFEDKDIFSAADFDEILSIDGLI